MHGHVQVARVLNSDAGQLIKLNPSVHATTIIINYFTAEIQLDRSTLP
jgi:hypothetical protein